MTSCRTVYQIYDKLDSVERKLAGYGFLRIHKSYLVNLKHVDMYDRQEAVLDNGERIVIAKRRYEDFCQAILAYMRENGGIV